MCQRTSAYVSIRQHTSACVAPAGVFSWCSLSIGTSGAHSSVLRLSRGTSASQLVGLVVREL